MLQEIITIVREAGKIILSAHDVENVTRTKEHNAANLVTAYDEAVQAHLREKLTALLPEADFLGEEGEHDPLTRDWLFIVDPIDGTTNFVRHLNYSNISVALAYRGEVRYGVVYNPYVDELFAAEKGRGATLNGRPIHVTDHGLDRAITLCGSTIYDRRYTDRSFAIMRHLYDRTMDFRRFGAAALDVCQVAAGRADVFFECRLSPWDYAAGSLILAEAGGILTRLDGAAADPREPGSVWATNAVCHEAWRELPGE